jgi:hypothetical protein
VTEAGFPRGVRSQRTYCSPSHFRMKYLTS